MFPLRRHAVVAIGSNLGDRRAAIEFAVSRLSGLLEDLVASPAIQTEPEGEHTEGQPPYLNTVVVGTTARPARELLDELLAIEQAFGRERPSPNAPRTLDLDLILLGDEIVDTPGLQVPHPRFRERFFVLGPLADVAPDLVDPVTGQRVVDLLIRLLRDESR